MWLKKYKEKEELKTKNNEMANIRTNEYYQAQISMPTQNIVLEQNKDITRTVKVMSLVGNILTLSTMKKRKQIWSHLFI